VGSAGDSDPTDLAQPYAASTQGSSFDAARRAYREAYGRNVLEIGAGGTIPFVAEFADAFPAAAILITSAGADPGSHAHSADESLHLSDFERVCLAETLLLAEPTATRTPPPHYTCQRRRHPTITRE
jgi:acetylornithine deacetylase/succinyl-diaminopimelate desuccinylase-like protein